MPPRPIQSDPWLPLPGQHYDPAMSSKKRLHRLIDRLSDQQAEDALQLLGARFGVPVDARARAGTNREGEDEISAVPGGWGGTLTGEPVPDAAAAVRRSRASH